MTLLLLLLFTLLLFTLLLSHSPVVIVFVATVSPEVFQLYGLGGLELGCNGPWLQLSGAWLPGGVASCPPMTQ